MSSESSEPDADRCRIAVDAAMDAALEECGGEDAVRRQMMDMFGFAADEDEPSCDDVLSEGLSDEVLNDLNRQREYAMCFAWTLVNNDDMSFRSAINTAWDRIREAQEEQ